jgi:hypothetical protein
MMVLTEGGRMLEQHQLEALIDLQVAILNGSAGGRVPTELGRLGHLHFENAQWRPDGPARVMRRLERALQAWEQPGEHHVEVTVAVAATALRRLWGITGVPLGPTAIAKRITSGGDPISEGGVRGWARQALEHARTHGVFDDLPQRLPVLPTSGRPTWDGDVLQWPAGADWRLLRAYTEREAFTSMSDNTLRVVLRDAVARRIRTEYLADESSAELGMHLAVTVLHPWQDADPNHLGPVVVGDALPDLEAARRSRVGAILQLLAFDSLDPAGLRGVYVGRKRLESVLGAAAGSPADHFADLADLAPEVRVEVMEALADEEREHDVDDTWDEQEAAFLDLGSLSSVDALEFSDLICAVPRRRKARLVKRYLELRLAAERSPVRTSDHALDLLDAALGADERHDTLYALADEAVHLELVWMNDQHSLDALARIIRAGRTRYRYELFAPRNAALMLTSAEARSARLVQLLEVQSLAGAERYADVIEELETHQQLALAVGSAATLLIENYLRAPHDYHESERLGRLCVLALRGSDAAIHLLDRLAAVRPAGLPLATHEDLTHLSRVGWVPTALDTRHRAQLAVHTAIGSGIAPALPEPGDDPASARGALDHTIDSIQGTYRRWVAHPQLTSLHTRNLGMQGSWLAMLNGGMLPYVPDASYKLVEAGVDFLLASPFTTPTSTTEVPWDRERSAAWHREVVQDGGELGRLPRNGAVAPFLDRRSGGAYGLWRRAL